MNFWNFLHLKKLISTVTVVMGSFFIKIKEIMNANLVVLFVILIIDLASKYHIKWILISKNTQFVKLLSNLNIVYVENHGIVFGLMQNANKLLIFLLILAVSIAVYKMIKSEKSEMKKTLFFIILGGAFGNLIDRILNGCVFDFIDLHFFGYHWYTFNIADVFISCSVCILLSIDLRDYVHSWSRSSIK